MRYSVFGICIVLSCTAAVGDDQVWTELKATGPTQTLTYSTCSPEECFGEGITHVLGCSSNSGDGFFEMTSTDRTLQIVNAIAALEGMKPAITLLIGDDSVSAAVGEMTLSHNDMDGGWNVTLEGYQFSDFFKAIAEGDLSKPVRIVVQGEEFDMNPSLQDTNRLKALALLCDPRG